MLNKVLLLCSTSAKKIQITFLAMYHSVTSKVDVFVNDVLVATYRNEGVTITVREGDKVYIQSSRLYIYKNDVSGADFSLTYDNVKMLHTAVITPTSDVVTVGTYNTYDPV